MTWIDYRHIKTQVKFDQVLSYYGIKLRQSGQTHLIGACPLPGHSGDRSNKTAFHVDIKKNAFNCFTHCGGGNIIDFVSKMECCEFREAAIKIHELFLIDDTTPDEKSKPIETIVKNNSDGIEIINKPLTFELKGLIVKHPFLLKEKNLTLETIKHFGLGFCSKGLLAGWIAIPIHNTEGQIVAYAGRAINSTQTEIEGKYKLPPGFQKMLEVYNLHRALEQKELIEKYGLILVESFFGVFWLWQNGYRNVVALMGRELSEQQTKTLLSVTNRFTLFLDGDEPGNRATEKIAAQILFDSFARVVKYPEGPKRKPAHFNKSELKTLLKTPR